MKRGLYIIYEGIEKYVFLGYYKKKFVWLELRFYGGRVGEEMLGFVCWIGEFEFYFGNYGILLKEY